MSGEDMKFNETSLKNFNYTLTEAKRFADENRIAFWIQCFLRECNNDYPNPNIGLADGLLLEERFYYGPVKINLDLIYAVRTEKDITDIEEMNTYNKIVDRITKHIPEWDMPPFLVEYRSDGFFLTDGNHRYSALRNSSINSYYAVIWGRICDKEGAIKSAEKLGLFCH